MHIILNLKVNRTSTFCVIQFWVSLLDENPWKPSSTSSRITAPNSQRIEGDARPVHQTVYTGTHVVNASLEKGLSVRRSVAQCQQDDMTSANAAACRVGEKFLQLRISIGLVFFCYKRNIKILNFMIEQASVFELWGWGRDHFIARGALVVFMVMKRSETFARHAAILQRRKYSNRRQVGIPVNYSSLPLRLHE